MQTRYDILDALINRHPELAVIADRISAAIDELVKLYRADGTLFLCGNGGSAADCDHICGELLKGFKSKRKLDNSAVAKFPSGSDIPGKLQNGLRAISLTSHPGLLSAFANDVDPNLIYAQQLWALGRPGDVLLGISTGGGSVNVKNAMISAHAIGMKTILLTGNRHGECEKYADVSIGVPESETYLIQEFHLPIYHAICLQLENIFFK
ncbi:MAG: SIS domain-containing protein [Victivallaceae bacterium]|nr:SIS domain-containing protein [Victivallaceae bacterium]